MECIPNALERALESCFQTSSARDFFHPTSTAAISEFEATAPNISAPFCHRRDFRHVENRTGDLPTHRHPTRLPAASTDTEMLNFAILLISFLFLVRHYLLLPKAKSKRFVLFIRRKRYRTLRYAFLRLAGHRPRSDVVPHGRDGKQTRVLDKRYRRVLLGWYYVQRWSCDDCQLAIPGPHRYAQPRHLFAPVRKQSCRC